MNKWQILLWMIGEIGFPMFMKQYGGCKGVKEITGMIKLLNSIGILSVVLFLAGVWIPFHNKSINKILGAMGVIGIVASENIPVFYLAHSSDYLGNESAEFK